MVKPLFLLGLPKTGTTLLQRVLASHAEISSSSEFWALLPPLTALQPRSIFADYGGRSCRDALLRMFDALPNGQADYLAAIEAFGNRLYNDLADSDATYFLDKTPRYHLIANDLVKAFPDARFLVIWRNPLSVMSSTILHNSDRLAGLRFAEFDILRGYPNLAAAEELAGDRGLSLRYEDFVSNPETELERIMDFLQLEHQPSQLSDFADTHFLGGDRNGIERRKIEKASLERWREVLSKPARRSYALRLLSRMDEAMLTTHGYERAELIKELSQLSVKWPPNFLAEYFSLFAAALYVKFQGHAIRTGRPDALLY